MKNKRGFTLIELLIVIALLGALAVGLLAALDPFEQLKKGADTGIRNTVSELQGAIVRYYSIKNGMPWEQLSPAVTSFAATNLSAAYTAINIQDVVSTGELKSDFSTLAGGQLSNITIMGSSQSVTVCFQPSSRSFRSDPNTKYYISAGTITSYTANNTGTCGDPGSATFGCFWCVE
ncbi:prepilin-type N-terminal cleavage/methylation domain-containing protein [Patescibacteria group bacterium]|nr:prepilin-type N-terminal cleavage/methylation domain-containing protein [Patescibacteria group bacterium]